MSTHAEKIEAQDRVFWDTPSEPWTRHIVGPAELEYLLSAADENRFLREILRDTCFWAGKVNGFDREGYSVLIDQDTAIRDVNYRDEPLHETREKAIEAAIEYYRAQS